MNPITIEVTVNSSLEHVWKLWNNPEDITHWAFAADSWECPHAENDLQVGGRFLTRMSAKDKSASFDLTGTYTEVIPHQKLAYTMDGGRKVSVLFEDMGGNCHVTETFDPENENSEEKQRAGWQAILNNFKAWAEQA